MSRDAEFAARWPLAQAYGWRLAAHMYKNDDGILVPAFGSYVKPPADFYCATHKWAGDYRGVTWHGQQVSVPSWFWEDDVLRCGRRAG